MHIIPSPCPNHIFNALMWKICTQEPRRSFSSPLTVLQIRKFSVLSSRFFILRWYAEIGSRILSSRNCSGQDESLKKGACMISPVSRSGNALFKHPSQIQFEEPSRANLKPSNYAPKFSDCDSWHAADEITETVGRLLSSCCLLPFKTSGKSLPSSRHTVILRCFCAPYACIIYLPSILMGWVMAACIIEFWFHNSILSQHAQSVGL